MDQREAKVILRDLFSFISAPLSRLSLGKKVDYYQTLWRIVGGEGPLSFEDPARLQEELESIQKALKDYLDKIMHNLQSKDRLLCEDLTIFYKVTIGVRVDPETHSLVVWRGGDLKTAVLAAFVEALATIPGVLGRIGRCENCGGWLIRLSQRQKRFCSAHCAAVGMTRERRKKAKIG